MNQKYNQTAMWITILIVAIIGMVVIQIGYTLITDQTTTTAVADDSFIGLNSTCVDVTDSCISSLTSVTDNATDTTLSTGNYSLCNAGESTSRYKDGIYLAVDSDYTGNILNATYTEVDCNHISGLTSLVINNVPILLGIALLVFVAGFVMLKK